MCRANPLWGAPRIHGELLKLGIDVSEATVSRHMTRRTGPPSHAWRTFLEIRAKDLIALDFFTVPAAVFRFLYVPIIVRHDRRRILHLEATANPTAGWTARQLLDACGLDSGPGSPIRDRDAIYGNAFIARLPQFRSPKSQQRASQRGRTHMPSASSARFAENVSTMSLSSGNANRAGY